MALNFKTLGVRALSALVFVAVLLGCLLWNYYSFTVFFFVVTIWGLSEFYNLSEKLNAKPFRAIGYTGAVIAYLSLIDLQVFFDREMIYPDGNKILLMIIPVMIFLATLFTKKENPIQNAMYTLGGIVYVALPLGLLHELVINEPPYSNGCCAETGVVATGHSAYYFPFLLFGIILLIWANDTFAYLGGSLFGKHKMIPRISPGKTWEGTLTGITLTFAGSFIVAQGNKTLWIVLGIVVPLAATLGDLVESLMKRQAGVKDTGTLMPGHGGILDRFDSLIFVSPVVFVIVKVFFA